MSKKTVVGYLDSEEFGDLTAGRAFIVNRERSDVHMHRIEVTYEVDPKKVTLTRAEFEQAIIDAKAAVYGRAALVEHIFGKED